MLSPALLFAQGDEIPGGAAAIMGMLLVPIIIALALLGLIIVGTWKLFQKAGKPGWASIVPIYNYVVLLDIVGRPTWWVILLIIPCTAPFAGIVVAIDLAKSFGKDTLYGLGIAFLTAIFLPLLGFSNATYVGPVAKK